MSQYFIIFENAYRASGIGIPNVFGKTLIEHHY